MMSEFEKTPLEEIFFSLPKNDFMPVLPDTAPLETEAFRQYQEKLRLYFLTGKKSSEEASAKVAPVMLSPYLRDQLRDLHFPAVWDWETDEMKSLNQVLKEVFAKLSDSDQDKLTLDRIEDATSSIQEKLGAEDPWSSHDLQVKEAFKVVRSLGDKLDDPKAFNEQCGQLETRFLIGKATLIGFSALAPFQILNHQLSQRKKIHAKFLHEVKKRITGLSEILLLHDKQDDSSQDHFNFAEGLLSLDKVKDLSRPEVSSGLSEDRLSRIRRCVNILTEARESYGKEDCVVFASQQVSEEFALNNILTNASIRTATDNPCARAKSFYDEEVGKFVMVIASLRLADLEINQAYNEELHAAYFGGFDLSYLSEEDIRYFRSILVIEDSQVLSEDPRALLSIFSEGAFLKVLALNRIEKLDVSVGNIHEDESYLELASLAIFRRNASVFQGGVDDPVWLQKSFSKGWDATTPVMWNLLLPKPESKDIMRDLLLQKTAITSRYFPSINYDLAAGDSFSSHFDITGNPQAVMAFPVFEQVMKSASGKENHSVSLTPADLFLLKGMEGAMLETIPSGFQSDHLLPLDVYLTSSPENSIGKIPYIWAADEESNVHRMAIPVSWIQRSRARLDYWRFIQEMGGVFSPVLQRNMEAAKTAWDAEKEAELENLKEQLQATFEDSRRADLEKAVRRMLNGLLDKNLNINIAANQQHDRLAVKQAGAGPVEGVKPAQTSETVTAQKEEAPTAAVSTEAWVESDLCTSCNDCINAVPGVFKYNDDKQAFVHNPKGGSYAKIVAAAEKCPAMCIHPGLPHNPDEPGLDKLKQRAEKYN